MQTSALASSGDDGSDENVDAGREIIPPGVPVASMPSPAAQAWAATAGCRYLELTQPLTPEPGTTTCVQPSCAC